jgi:hypothetical protein
MIGEMCQSMIEKAAPETIEWNSPSPRERVEPVTFEIVSAMR